MDINTYWKARALYKRGYVVPELKDRDTYFFEVRDKSVRVNLKTKDYNCTCEAGSIWKQGEECCHVKACLKYIEDYNSRKSSKCE